MYIPKVDLHLYLTLRVGRAGVYIPWSEVQRTRISSGDIKLTAYYLAKKNQFTIRVKRVTDKDRLAQITEALLKDIRLGAADRQQLG